MSPIGTPPDHTPLGARLAERTAALAPDDAAEGYAHAHLAEALEQPFEQLAEVFDPVDAAPFETLLDPARCPEWALPWLAQLVGVGLPETATVADKRTIIVGLAGQTRGTPGAIAAAAGLYLTGEKTVIFRERHQTATDPPYTLEVVTRTGETPDAAKVLAAMQAQKPGGILLVYRQVAGWDYEQLTTTGPDPYSALASAFTSYQDLEEG